MHPGRRFCRPLPNSSATTPSFSYGVYSDSLIFLLIWSERRGSNPRPQPWQGCALPTKLLSHVRTRFTPLRLSLLQLFAVLPLPLKTLRIFEDPTNNILKERGYFVDDLSFEVYLYKLSYLAKAEFICLWQKGHFSFY